MWDGCYYSYQEEAPAVHVHLVTFLETCVAGKTQQGVILHHVIAGAYPYTYQEDQEAPALHVYLVTFLETHVPVNKGGHLQVTYSKKCLLPYMDTCVQKTISYSMPRNVIGS